MIGSALTVNAGIRVSAVNDGFKTRTPVLFDGGVAYALPTKTLLRGSYSTGYKVNKAFFLWWGSGLFIQRPGSEGLRPSKTDTLEVGVEQTLLSTSRSSGMVRVSYYRTDEVDLFNFGNTGNGVPFYDDARIRGTEVWTEWRFARLRPFGSFTWLRTERTASTNPAATNVDLRFTPLPNYAASFGTAVDVTSRFYAAIMGNYDDGGVNEQVVNDDIAVTRFESFVKVNASANYKLSERVSLTLRLENLLNQRDLGYSRSVLGVGRQQSAHHRHAARSRHDRRRRAAGAVLAAAGVMAVERMQLPQRSWLGTFLADPRRTFLRRALFQIHLWVGIGLGVYVFVICVSGSALVFHHELAELALAEYHHVPAGEQPDEASGRRGLTLSEVAAIMDRDRPDLRVLSLRPPEHADGTFEAGVLSNRKYHLAYVHPVTGAITGPVPPGGAVLSLLHELHANLLSLAGMGRWLNGIGGGFLFLLCVTGIIIWWPGRGRWARAMKVDRRANWKRINFDLHNATGFWLLLPIAVLAITGSYFTWPRQYRAAVASVLPVTAAEPPKSNPKNKGLTPPPSIDDLVERARAEAPGLSLVRVGVPTGPEQVYTVFMRDAGSSGDAEAPRTMTRVQFDRYTGALLQVTRPDAPRTSGDRVIEWLGPLHTGNYGGTIVKSLYVVMGLTPALLFVTGFVMWWQRVIARRWRCADGPLADGGGARIRARPASEYVARSLSNT